MDAAQALHPHRSATRLRSGQPGAITAAFLACRSRSGAPPIRWRSLTLTAKTGTCVVTGMGAMTDVDVKLNLFLFTMLQKTLKGNIFGGGSSHVETPKLVGLYKSGLLKIDEMVTNTYSLDDINDGYQDMIDGKNIRGVIKFTESDW
jgi:S-(hydroxymethyl)glutathione dehydrogenase / alcohol dehydrogenase